MGTDFDSVQSAHQSLTENVYLSGFPKERTHWERQRRICATRWYVGFLRDDPVCRSYRGRKIRWFLHKNSIFTKHWTRFQYLKRLWLNWMDQWRSDERFVSWTDSCRGQYRLNLIGVHTFSPSKPVKTSRVIIPHWISSVFAEEGSSVKWRAQKNGVFTLFDTSMQRKWVGDHLIL